MSPGGSDCSSRRHFDVAVCLDDERVGCFLGMPKQAAEHGAHVVTPFGSSLDVILSRKNSG